MTATRTDGQVDVVLVGAGIVSATLASLLNELLPDLSIQVFEQLEDVALESTQPMNNAGTGHAANCELNYTPEKGDGTVDIAKALAINEAFEVSLQLWTHLVEKGALPAPKAFIRPVPHLSFVWGEKNVRFLHARQAQLSAHPMFQDMRISEDAAELEEWMPLVMQGREPGAPRVATRVDRGTDLNFGVLAREMFAGLKTRADFSLHLRHKVQDLTKDAQGRWRVRVQDLAGGGTREVCARFVFIGAGGGALPLLLKSGIPEGHGYGGFPVSGQWLVCSNPEVIAQHQAKVYGKASVGAPPMSVPHLDTRMIDGTRALLFGPYAGFTTKYLKHGSYLDMPRALHLHNLWPMAAAAWHNLDLTRYLIGEVLQSPEKRMDALREFMPEARTEDWKLEIAGQRVQIIKKDPKLGGKLEFGTELVTAADGSLAALLGASPGASTAAATMIMLIHRCFPDHAKTQACQDALQRMIPSYGHSLAKEPELLRSVRERTGRVLGLR
jgi:malate dehydrogenase (quinone)